MPCAAKLEKMSTRVVITQAIGVFVVVVRVKVLTRPRLRTLSMASTAFRGMNTRTALWPTCKGFTRRNFVNGLFWLRFTGDSILHRLP